MNPGEKKEEVAENWEQMLSSAGLQNKTATNPTTTTQEGEKKPARKPLQLKKNAAVFVSNPDAKEDFALFFKEEIEAFLKAKSGKMFQSAPVKVPVTKTFPATTTKETATTKKETKKDVKEPTKEEKKEKELKAQEENKKKRELKRLEKEVKKKESKKTVIDIDSVVKDKSKWDVEVDETREPLNIVFIGHVDSGKSTICGGLLLWTGKVDPLELKKLEAEAKEKNRESWYLAYLMDINEEEKAKGKTVEVGRATFELQTKRFTILDAPGHKNYVPNMIQGAAQADVACLVISAKAGEFESGFDKGGQTREHAMLARSLGVTELIILVNKMDEGSVNWSKVRFDEIKGKLGPFLQKACGYDIEKNVKWIPISGLLGINIKDKLDPKVCDWYKGDPLLTVFDNLPVPARDRNAAIRIPVLDKLKDQGALYVLGKVENGTVHPGQTVTFLPSCEEAQIISVMNNDDKRIPYGKPGENVKLQIKGADEDQIAKGDIVCSNESWTQVCEQFEAKITILELPEHKPIMSNGYTCVLHMHTALEEVEIFKIVSEYDRTTKENKPARFLKSGYIGNVRIQTKNPICCEKYEVMPSLGRFTLRDEGRTIAMGRITLIKPLFKAD